MVATFFAKVDTQLQDANKKTAEIDAYFRRFEANFVNPQRELDGKLYSMKMKMDAGEQMRESQFMYLKMAIQKLISSLETQSYSNI